MSRADTVGGRDGRGGWSGNHQHSYQRTKETLLPEAGAEAALKCSLFYQVHSRDLAATAALFGPMMGSVHEGGYEHHLEVD